MVTESRAKFESEMMVRFWVRIYWGRVPWSGRPCYEIASLIGTTKYALRVANPRATDQTAGGYHYDPLAAFL
jgi:hypothetical protein